MQPSLLEKAVNEPSRELSEDVKRTFLHALLVLPGTERAIFFQLSTSPCIETACVSRLSSYGVHGFPMPLSPMSDINIYLEERVS